MKPRLRRLSMAVVILAASGPMARSNLRPL
jgi:hypothetical protein